MRFSFLLETLKFVLELFLKNSNFVPDQSISHYWIFLWLIIKNEWKYLKTASLNRRGSTILSDVYSKEITKVFKWHAFSNSGFDDNNSNDSFQIDKRDEFKNI